MFLKMRFVVIGGLLLLSDNFTGIYAQSPVSSPKITEYSCYGKLANGVPCTDKLGWKVGIQSYSFKRVATLFEAIDMTAALGLKYIEAVGMQIAPDTEERFGPDMSQVWIDQLNRKLKEAGVECTSYYKRLKGATNPTDAENTFRFCQKLGLMLVTDPVRVTSGNGSMDFYENLAKKYGVRMVLTNHPKKDNSPYWNPDVVLQDLEGRDKLLGASVDIGHFMRDGYVPLDIVKKYIAAGRMYHFHFRDVDGLGSQAKDVVVDEGAGQVRDLFKILHDNDVKPVMVLEYERDFYNQMLFLIPSVNNINSITSQW